MIIKIIDLIEKKRGGSELSREEVEFMISAYTAGEIPDYQMSAMLMAIYFVGMTRAETFDLTMTMMRSGDILDLSGISGIKADKHSTGGVGDKTSLVLCPMMAAVGVKMPKMSGRGLGHTGGTIDKLESIPGFSCDLSLERFYQNVNEVGFAICGQTANLVPADKKLYALRDVTGTVPSLPLIVSSIMSKKLASGADIIVLDVKTGSGGFMKTDEASFELANEMVRIGRQSGNKTVAVISDMDQPLGFAVGNALEVREAIETLSGSADSDLMELCLCLGASILTETGMDRVEAYERLMKTVSGGAALGKLREFIKAQGGNDAIIDDLSLLPLAPHRCMARVDRGGYVCAINAEKVGVACRELGGGHISKDSAIDHSVGIILKKKIGDQVLPNDAIAEIHAGTDEDAFRADLILREAFSFSDLPPQKRSLIRGIIS